MDISWTAGRATTAWPGSCSGKSGPPSGAQSSITACSSTSTAGGTTWDTGDLDVLREPYPRLLRFAEYLESIRQPDGLLPVENIGVPSVWIDHHAYQKQRHKQCAFNLYTAAMAEHALANIARAFGDTHRAEQFVLWGRETLNATIDEFWSEEHGLFINNLPWLEDEKQRRLDDRSLATAVLFDQCPAARVEPALGVLADCPTDMGLSYPANAGWRLWALAKLGRVDVVLRDLRTRWATMSSVIHNNTLQEEWQAKPDTGDQWSHCPVAPMYVLFMDICGIRPPGPRLLALPDPPATGRSAVDRRDGTNRPRPDPLPGPAHVGRPRRRFDTSSGDRSRTAPAPHRVGRFPGDPAGSSAGPQATPPANWSVRVPALNDCVPFRFPPRPVHRQRAACGRRR